MATKDEIFQSALLHLPIEEREELASALFDSLGVGDARTFDPLEAVTEAEVLKRLDDVRSGRETGTDAFAVLEDIRLQQEHRRKK